MAPPTGSRAASARVQILLLNWNGWRDTIACLRSVYDLEYSDFGVVVCDNASSDGSLERICEWADTARRASRPLKVMQLNRESAERSADGAGATADLVLIQTGNNLGFAGGNNVGLRYLLRRNDCKYLWLLNNDTVVAPSALAHLVDRADADPSLGAIGGTLLELRDPGVVQEAGAWCSSWHGMTKAVGAGQPVNAVQSEPRRLDYINGGCLLVRASTVRRIGLLDERYFLYSEDADWGIRMRRAGYRLAHVPQAHVWHRGGSSAAYSSPAHDYFVVKSALLLIHKHYPGRLPIAFLYSLYRCLLPKIVRLQWQRFRAVIRAYRDVVRQLRERRGRAAGEEVETSVAGLAAQR